MAALRAHYMKVSPAGEWEAVWGAKRKTRLDDGAVMRDLSQPWAFYESELTMFQSR